MKARLRFLLRERDVRGAVDEEVLSVYRDLGVVPKAGRDDNFNKTPEDRGLYKLVLAGDVVVNKMKAWQGSIAVSAHRGIVSGDYLVCEVVGEIHRSYLHYLLRSRPLISEYATRSKGVRPSQWRLYWEDLADIEIQVPPWPLQVAIADYLDAETARIDALIEKKRRIIELLEERFRELRRASILRDFDPSSGAGSLPLDWHNVSLGVLVELQRGHDLPADSRSEGPVPVISSGGPSGWHDTAAAAGPGVVTGRYGTIGEVFYSEGDYWPLNTTLYVKDFRGCWPRWVYHLLASVPLDIDSAKSAVTGINRNVIGVLRVPRPPEDVQRTIAETLDVAQETHDLMRRRLTDQLTLLAEHRQALITAAVTGQLDIPGVAA
jgi:type I restriction enzyme S subunit